MNNNWIETTVDDGQASPAWFLASQILGVVTNGQYCDIILASHRVTTLDTVAAMQAKLVAAGLA